MKNGFDLLRSKPFFIGKGTVLFFYYQSAQRNAL